MDWILDNLQLIIVVAGSIAYWINQRAREKAGQEADYDQDGIPDNRPQAGPGRVEGAETRELKPVSRDGSDPEADERRRRIQEEIRRKIAERRGQPVAPPLPVPELDPFRPVFQETTPPAPPTWRSEPANVPPPMPTAAQRERAEEMAQEDSAALERQRKLEAQLAQLEERRREARRAAHAAAESGGQAAANVAYAVAAPDVPGLSASRLQDELKNPRALRRAMVLKEVLGTPVALR